MDDPRTRFFDVVQLRWTTMRGIAAQVRAERLAERWPLTRAGVVDY